MELTVLISSAGRRNQLLNCFRQDAVTLGVKLRVLATDLRPDLSSACQQADAAFEVPRCTSSEFIPTMIELCRKQDVSLLVPTIDTELEALSSNREQFAAVGTRVVVSSPDVVSLARSKLTTGRRLLACGIPTPDTMTLADYLRNPSKLRQPVIAKPTAGSASIGIVRPQQVEDLLGLDVDRYIVQELWQGREYTVNMFFDQREHLQCAIPHERLEVRAGEVSKGVTRQIPILAEVAKKIELALPGAVGPLCFQVVVLESGVFAVFEINARFGGGYPLAHRAGARFSQWLLEEACNLPSSANCNWKSGVTMLRYDEAVFIDD